MKGWFPPKFARLPGGSYPYATVAGAAVPPPAGPTRARRRTNSHTCDHFFVFVRFGGPRERPPAGSYPYATVAGAAAGAADGRAALRDRRGGGRPAARRP